MDEVVLLYTPRGAARDLLQRRDPEIVLDGPAGTGKTYAALQKLHMVLLKRPNVRALMVRKTHASLKATALVTYQERVLHPLDGVKFYGGSAAKPAQFRYPNGSVLVVGGMDKPDKIMSSEYDIAYVNEATDLTQEDWEKIGTRLRSNRMPYQQLIGDCNPQAPNHWLKKRMDEGRTARLISRHEDNPTVTSEYLARLDALTGVRRQRLRLGLWAAAEGGVYSDVWDPARNVINRFAIPKEWPRYLVVDFGYENPFVCLWVAVDTDGRLYIYREIYMSHRLVEDHAQDIKRHSAWGTEHGDPYPVSVICDHDAEDRATLQRHLNMYTLPAPKAVSAGIQSLSERMRVAGDGKPRFFYLRDSLVERDTHLAEQFAPTSFVEEVDGYVWDLKASVRKDTPVKKHDHAMDASRYISLYLAEDALQAQSTDARLY